jgi:hypothetical protein
MQSLLLFNPDLSAFDPTAVESAFLSRPEFQDVRFEETGGALIECQYFEPDDWTIIRLSGDAATISTSNTGYAALRAALLIQRSLGIPLRMVNDDNTFDLTFSNITTVEELEAAMEDARTS